jgi:hypothetical protein
MTFAIGFVIWVPFSFDFNNMFEDTPEAVVTPRPPDLPAMGCIKEHNKNFLVCR